MIKKEQLIDLSNLVEKVLKQHIIDLDNIRYSLHRLMIVPLSEEELYQKYEGKLHTLAIPNKKADKDSRDISHDRYDSALSVLGENK